MSFTDGTTELTEAEINKLVSAEETRRIFERSAVVYLNGATPAVASVIFVNDGFDLSIASLGGVYTIGFSGPAFTQKPAVVISIQSHDTSVKGYYAEGVFVDSDTDKVEVRFQIIKDNAKITNAQCYVHILVIGEIA